MTAPIADLDNVVIAVPGLQLEVVVADPRWSDLAMPSVIEPMLAAVVAEFEDPLGSACLALSNDDHVHQLNKQFRGMDKATNVLSFPDGDQSRLGDLILAYETCVHEAHRDDKALQDHYLHLILHGLLHLLGFDHTTSEEAEEMEALERDILASLGIPDPYDDETFELG